MKKVFTSSYDVIHLFAQRSQDEARVSNRSVYFNNETKIYSYGSHYLLGEFLDANTIMINDDGYSVTTSKHISQIKGATSQYRQFLKSESDIDRVHSHVIANKNRLANARKPEMYINPILNLWSTLNTFLEYSKAKKYKSNKKYREIKSIVNALNNGSDDFKEKLRLAAIKEAKAQKRKDAKELVEKLEKFNNYEINFFRVGKEDYLRLSQDGERVETSQHVSVKRENAKLLYQMIERGIEIKGKHIENYVVTSINGTLKIGCHSINIESMHKIGKSL